MTLQDFKSNYKTIDKVKGSDKQGTLFESICYLIEKEPKNQKTVDAIEIVLTHYVRIEVVQETDYDNAIVNKRIISLLDVPMSVAEAITKRAEALKRLEENIVKRRNEKIIELLKVEDDELSK